MNVDAPLNRVWECGCWSDNTVLDPCADHAEPVGLVKGLRASDPRLNVVFGPSLMTLHFPSAQGGPGRMSAVLSRESLLKVMKLMGDLDETPEPDEDDDFDDLERIRGNL